jgi:hypothetical protein
MMFNIQLEQSCSSDNYLPPDDPLGELSHFEMGLRRFCYERNHRVIIDACDRKIEVCLHPDLSLLIQRLPEKISDLSRGNEVILELSESWMDIKFSPANGKLVGSLQTFGEAPDVKTCELNSAEVITALTRFVQDVIQSAVAGGYVTEDDARKFLREINGSDERI